MYAAIPEQAVKMRGLARRMRRDAGETANSYYQRIMQLAALDLEIAAEKLERAGWQPPADLH